MALAKVVCGDCGGDLSPSDVYCPHCGVKIERQLTQQQQSRERKCGACGYVNAGTSPFCESCGARLEGVSAPAGRQAEPRKEQKKQQPRGERSKRFEPWQMIALASIVILVGFLVYIEATKTQPGVATSAPPPATSQSTPPPPALGPLEEAVHASPRDPGALIRLANGLHDNKMYVRAIDIYRKYLAIKPDDPNARVDMGICYFELAMADSLTAGEDYAAAVKEMELAFRSTPTHQPAAFNLGIVFLHMGNLDSSNARFTRAYQLNQNSDLGMRAQKFIQEHTIPQ
jgi:predicted RNA-binding Zn-ribbon protein involved in translation (DUF1610 family)